MKVELSKEEAKNLKYFYFLNRDELLALHEALAFAYYHRDKFNTFIKRNKPNIVKKIIKAIGYTESGANLIGKIYRVRHSKSF